MCYPKPGPRCSNHAKKEYIRAKTELMKNENKKTKQAFFKAYKDYMLTPEGIKSIEEKAQQEKDLEQRKLLLEQAQMARKTRKEMVQEYKKVQGRKESQNNSLDKNFVQKIEPSSLILKKNIRREMSEISFFVDYDYVDYYDNEVDQDSIVIKKVFPQELANELVDKTDTNSSNEEFLEFARKLEESGLDNPNLYKAEVVNSYYDSIDVSVSPKDYSQFNKKIEEIYYSKNNAKDSLGILEYVRSKGTPTAGKNPLNAIKYQLGQENSNKKHSLVEKANDVSVSKISLTKLRIPTKTHYESCEPRESKSYNGSQEFDGVVFHDREKNTFTLVDGYHRTKMLTEKKKRKTGKYIVLNER